MKRTDRCRGFTLLELLLVMVVVGMMLSAGVAGFFGMGKGARMRGAVNNVRSAVALARQQAIVHGETMELVFEEVETDRWAYYLQTATGGQVYGDKRYLAPGVVFGSSTPDSILFRPDGGSGSAAKETIVLEQTEGPEKWEITVYGLTGVTSAEEKT